MSSCFFIFTFAMLTPAVEKAGADDSLEKIKELHRAARESIVTLHCKVDLSVTVINKKEKSALQQSCKSECWITRNALRIRANDDGRITDSVWKDAIRTSLVTPPGPNSEMTGDRGSMKSMHIQRGDPFIRGLLLLQVPDASEFLTFEQLVERAEKVDVRTVAVEGKKAVVADLHFQTRETGAKWKLEITFDPSVNYLIRKVVRRRLTQQQTVMERIVTEFKEVDKGVFFPVQVHKSDTSEGVVTGHSVCTITDITANKNIPDSVFALNIPPGILFADSTRGSYYKTGQGGGIGSAERKLGRGILPPSPAANDSGDTKETVTEPRSTIEWIMIAAITVVLVAFLTATVYVVKQRRESNARY